MDAWDQIWRRLRAGDASAYAFLLDRLGPGVWGYLRRMTGRDDLADELFSRTWLRVVQTAGRIRSPRAIRQYVLSIARRQWLDELDHRCLNDVPGLANPTSEMLCKYLWDCIAADLPALSAITVWESDTSRCVYRGQ